MVEAKDVERSMNITDDLKQGRSDHRVWFPYGKVLPDI